MLWPVTFLAFSALLATGVHSSDCTAGGLPHEEGAGRLGTLDAMQSEIEQNCKDGGAAKETLSCVTFSGKSTRTEKLRIADLLCFVCQENSSVADWDPEFVKSVQDYVHFFPLAPMSTCLEKRGVAPAELAYMYRATVTRILLEFVQIPPPDWPSFGQKLSGHFGVGTFWRLLLFIEDHPQYAALLAKTIRWSVHMSGYGIEELRPERLEALIRTILDDPDAHSRHEALNAIAARLAEESVGKCHPYPTDRFELARRQCRSTLFTVFNGRLDDPNALDRHILSISARAGEPGCLHDLQVALIINKAQTATKRYMLKEHMGMLEKAMAEYSTEQLRYIYESNDKIYFVFHHRQLFEFDPHLFRADCPAGENQIFALLSKIYRGAHPDHKSIFGLILESLSQESYPTELSATLGETITGVLEELPPDQGFLENSEECRVKFEQEVYARCSDDVRYSVLVRFGPECTTEPLADKEIIDFLDSTTFSELLSYAVGMGVIQVEKVVPDDAEGMLVEVGDLKLTD